jgi:hypothetical protein
MTLVEAMPEEPVTAGTNRARVNFGVYVYRDENPDGEPAKP